jgi:GT2 family glycosyltransferase
LSASAHADGIRLSLQARHELVEAGPGRWLAVGDDPQFLLTWPGDLPPGLYRLVFELSLPPGSDPCLFLDQGAGWSQRTQVALASRPGEPWSCIVRLDGQGRPARLDPFSRQGEFGLGNAYANPVTEVEAVLSHLESAARRPGSQLSGAIEAMQRALAQGEDIACQLAAVCESDGYAAWVDANATPDASVRNRMRALLDELPRRPMLSIAMNLENLSVDRLSAALAAVREQIYPDWELRCIAPGGEATSAQRSVLAHYARACSRVDDRVLGDDAVAVMEALTGEWLVTLDAGARPAPHALLALACTAIGAEHARLVYADEDRVDESGHRGQPVFKPAWDVELARSGRDPRGPFALHAMHALRGGAAPGDVLDDTLRRFVRDVPADAAVHLPLLLTQVPIDPMPLERDSGPVGTPARPAPLAEHPSVALVIPTRDRVSLLSRCVDRILASPYPHLSVVVVDNGSTEQATLDYCERIAADRRVSVVRDDQPFNYSALNNRAISRLDADIVGLVNNDIEPINDDWLETMVAHAVQPGVGAVGAMLYYPDDTIQHAGVVIGVGGVAAHAFAHLPRGSDGPQGLLRCVRSVSAVTAACMLVRRDVYQRVGGLDERLAVAFNDVDFCLRIRQMGLRIVWTPHAELYHHESASRGSEDSPEKRARFESEVRLMQERWGHDLLEDPAYHPALSLEPGHAYELGWPARFSLRDWADQPTRGGRTSTQWPSAPRIEARLQEERGTAAIQE